MRVSYTPHPFVCERSRARAPVVRFQTDNIIIVINKNVRRTATTKALLALGGADGGFQTRWTLRLNDIYI